MFGLLDTFQQYFHYIISIISAAFCLLLMRKNESLKAQNEAINRQNATLKMQNGIYDEIEQKTKNLKPADVESNIKRMRDKTL